MSRVPDEPRSWPGEGKPEQAASDLKRQLDDIRAKVAEHRTIMRLAGLTSTDDAEGSEPKG